MPKKGRFDRSGNDSGFDPEAFIMRGETGSQSGPAGPDAAGNTAGPGQTGGPGASGENQAAGGAGGPDKGRDSSGNFSNTGNYSGPGKSGNTADQGNYYNYGGRGNFYNNGNWSNLNNSGNMNNFGGFKNTGRPKIVFPNSGNGGRKVPDGKTVSRVIMAIAAVLIVFLIIWNSFYNVDEQHNAVVTQFGNVIRTDTAGLHFKVPLLQRAHMVDMTTHGVGIGYDDNMINVDTITTDSVMITSDFNLLDIDFYMEYKVSDPVAYLYNSLKPEEVLQNMALAAIRSTVVNYTVDEAMTTGKSQIQAEIKEKLQTWLADDDIGLQVINIQVQDAQPPTAEIQRAFKEVENAKQSKDTALNNARQYQNEQIPRAEAEADRIRQNAQATKEARIAEAEGQAARFNTIFVQYQANPLITRQRLFYEAMEDILPGKKVIFTDGSTQELLPIASFSALNGGEAND